MKTKLLICDFDGTLTKEDVLDMLCGLAGAKEKSRHINESYISGEIIGSDALRRRYRLIDGVCCESASALLADVELTSGARRLISYAKDVGIKTLVVSGNFDFVIEHFKKSLGFDDYICSHIPTENGKIGSVDSPDARLVDKYSDVLKYLSNGGFSAGEVIAIGDSASDRPIFDIAGLGFGINWKGKKLSKIKYIDSLDEIIKYMVV